jgi:hypothetical protein
MRAKMTDGEQSGGAGSQGADGKKAHETKRPAYKRAGLWIGGIVTATAVAVGVAIGTGIGQHVDSALFRPRPTPSPSPLSIAEEVRNGPVEFDNGMPQAWVLPYTLHPSASDKDGLPRPESELQSVSGYETPNSYIDRFAAWVASQNGATAGLTYVRLTLTAGPAPIVIQSICAKILKRSPILKGTLFYKSSQGEEPVETTINLDSAEPCAAYFTGHYIDISPNASVVVDLRVVAYSDTVTWSLLANAVVNGRQEFLPAHTEQVFRTTGILKSIQRYGIFYDFVQENGSEEFLPTEPAPVDAKQVQDLAG